MNALGFFMHRLAWQFGIKGERARWGAVTRETQLLAEAQDLLGKLSWPGLESADEISGEYWMLRDLDGQQQTLRDSVENMISENDNAQDRLYDIEDRYEQQVQGIQGRKKELMEKAVVIMEDVEQIKDRDSDTRRRFSSLKAKLEVLKKQDGDYGAEIEKTRAQLVKLKEEHTRDLSDIAARESEVEKLEQGVTRLDEEIATRRDAMREETTDLVAEIGRRSKLIAENSAKIGSLDTRKGELSFRIGQFLSNNLDSKDPGIQAVLRDFRPIVTKIKDLRTSVQYNQRLARRIGR